MATIQASIQLTDGMSPALRSMNKALNVLLNTFEATQVASGKAVDTASIQVARNELARAAVSMNNFEDESRQAAAAQQNLTATVERTNAAAAKTAAPMNRVEKEINQNTAAENRLNQSVQRTSSAASKAAASINRIETEINQNTAAQQRFNNKVSEGTSRAGALWGKLKGLAATYFGLQAAKGIIGTADQLTMTKARLDLINDGMLTTAELEDKIYQMAQRSRGGFMETADAVAKLGQRTGNLFKSNDETIAFTETLNKMFVVAGTSQAEMASATLQLTQALGSGVLRGEEFNAVFEAAPNVMQAVADSIGQPIGKLKELASDGKISASIVKNAILGATEKVNKQFESMPYTWAQVWTTIKNYTLKATRPILQAISDITKNERFIAFANEVGNVISRIAGFIKNLYSVLAPALGWIFDKIAGIYNFIKNNWSLIAPIIGGIALAFVALKAPMMAMWLWTTLCTVATKAWAVAQGIYNAVASANPIMLVVLGIILFIALIYLAVAAINKWCGTSYSATGLICGYFTALYAHIYNIISYIWDIIASVVEFFVNVWKHPMYSVKKLFVNLATNVLDMFIAMTEGCDEFATNFVNAILWAVNKALEGWNWFVDKLGIVGEKMGLGKAEKIEATASITSNLKDFKSKLESSVGEAPKDYWTAPKMEKKSIGDYYMKGYNWGADKATQVENFFSGKNFKMLTGDDLRSALENGLDKFGNPIGTDDKLNDIGKALSGGLGSGSGNPALDKIASGVDDIAGNTADISDSLDTSSEDLSFMRDLAERRAINRYYYTDMNVTQNNNNNIRNGVDADAVIEKLRRGIFETLSANAEGVHI